MTTKRRLLLIHGRDFKPQPETYEDISISAMRAGIERDYPDCVNNFDGLAKSIAWYGDLNAEVLVRCGKTYDETLDVGDRRSSLATMREFATRKRFGIRQYDHLPGKSAVPEFVADLLAPVLTGKAISLLAKDVAEYFDRKSDFAMRVRERVREQLCELLADDDEVALVTHGTGSVIAYDVLWQLSHDPDLRDRCGEKKVDLWLTLGSPLGNSNIQKRLLGSQEKVSQKYPLNVIAWHNVSAEDDYTCHDNTLADDYSKMMQERLVSAVHDYKIFNHAVRYGKSNPHSSVGYFIHPRVSKILSDWLSAKESA